MKKKALSLLLALVMMMTLAVPALAVEGEIIDTGMLTENDWYYDAAQFVLENGYMDNINAGLTPTGDKQFCGAINANRATVFSAFYAMQGSPAVEGEATFSDVAGTSYADAAAWAEAVGLSEGDGAGLFQGEREVTRAELATIVVRYAAIADIDLTTGSGASEMADWSSVATWATEGMSTCYASGIITGKPGDLLDPAGNTTRGELATILTRVDSLVAYTVETVSIDVPETDKIPAHTIIATVTLPTGEGNYPAVVMLHGTGSNRDEAGMGYAIAAPVMAKFGIASIRLDFMGNGDSTASYSDYNYTSANIDAKAAADYMAALSNVKASEIAVMGWSQGGTNALLAAAAYPETFNAVITWAGATDLKNSGLFSEGFAAAYKAVKKDGSYTMKFDWREDLVLGQRWFDEVDSTDVLKTVAKIEAPILAINGAADTVVDPANAEKIFKAAKNAGSDLLIIDACDHTFNVFTGDYSALATAIGAGIRFINDMSVVEGTVTTIEKYGHALLDVAIADMPFEFGDVLTVTFDNGFTVDAPYLDDYFVENGEYLVRGYRNHTYIGICINYGKLNEVANVDVGAKATITLAEKGGYLAEYEALKLERTYVRSDYASDEVYANFRPIVMGNIAEGKLYRSSSPINPELNRASYASKLAGDAGVKTFINLADSLENLETYFAAETFDSPYYKSIFDEGGVVYLSMPVAYTNEEFKTKLGEGLVFMAEHEGPYLVHCNEGKDRAGFTSALLEALMGASLEEIRADYMTSYLNYYHVEKDSDQYLLIQTGHLDVMLTTMAGLEKGADLTSVDLAKAATEYILSAGVTQEQIDSIVASLSGK